MNKVPDIVLKWIDHHLDALVSAPPMWGSNEAVEMQAILLFELRALILRPDETSANPSQVFDTYTRFLRERFPTHNPAPLCELSGVPFTDTLSEFRRLLESRIEPEDAFQHSDLVIRLQYKPDSPPTAISFTGYCDEIRRVARSFGRAHDKTTGRVRREIEEITDFAIKDTRILQQNGAPAEAWAMFQRGDSAQGHLYAADEVRSALSSLAQTAAWLESDSPVRDLRIDDAERRVRVGVQMLRLLPRRDVAVVQVGGLLSGATTPFSLRSTHAGRCVAIVSHDAAASAFDETREIRGIDLDRGTIAFGKKPRITCYVPSEILGADIREVGVTARVRGRMYALPLAPSFVIAESVEILDSAQGEG